MNNIEKKKIIEYIKTIKFKEMSGIVCDISENFKISLQESLDIYNDYIKRCRMLESDSIIDIYTKNAIPFETDKYGIPVVGKGEW